MLTSVKPELHPHRLFTPTPNLRCILPVPLLHKLDSRHPPPVYPPSHAYPPSWYTIIRTHSRVHIWNLLRHKLAPIVTHYATRQPCYCANLCNTTLNLAGREKKRRTFFERIRPLLRELCDRFGDDSEKKQALNSQILIQWRNIYVYAAVYPGFLEGVQPSNNSEKGGSHPLRKIFSRPKRRTILGATRAYWICKYVLTTTTKRHEKRRFSSKKRSPAMNFHQKKFSSKGVEKVRGSALHSTPPGTSLCLYIYVHVLCTSIYIHRFRNDECSGEETAPPSICPHQTEVTVETSWSTSARQCLSQPQHRT